MLTFIWAPRTFWAVYFHENLSYFGSKLRIVKYQITNCPSTFIYCLQDELLEQGSRKFLEDYKAIDSLLALDSRTAIQVFQDYLNTILLKEIHSNMPMPRIILAVPITISTFLTADCCVIRSL